MTVSSHGYSYIGRLIDKLTSDVCLRNVLLFLFKVNTRDTKYNLLLCTIIIVMFIQYDTHIKIIYLYFFRMLFTQKNEKTQNTPTHIRHRQKIQIA